MADQSEKWNAEMQRVLLSFMISAPDAFTKARSIIEDRFFDNHLSAAARFILDYADEFRTLPLPAQVMASTGVAIDALEVSPQHSEWFLKNIEEFCRYRALELAVMNGMDLLQKGRGGEVEALVRDAMTISLASDLGMDFFEDVAVRIKHRRDSHQYFTTGWSSLDRLLRGGFTKGGLNIFAGGSGCVAAGTKVRVIKIKSIHTHHPADDGAVAG